MILPLHIIIALLSLISATVLFFLPSRTKLQTTYGLVAATILSGSYLTWLKPVHLTATCVTGLIYLGAISFAIVSARHKLARA